ncbi:hypothetical protein LguiA_011071 [Lonicera macranthoides]
MKKAAWRLTSIGDLRGLASNFNQWWNMIVANLKMEELAVAAMMLNQLIWQGKSLSEMVVVCQALCLLAQWQSAKLGINGARNLGENEGLSTNHVAHKLAQTADSSSNSKRWEYVLLSFVLDLLAVDFGIQ